MQVGADHGIYIRWFYVESGKIPQHAAFALEADEAPFFLRELVPVASIDQNALLATFDE
jgi:hypothetical protein